MPYASRTLDDYVTQSELQATKDAVSSILDGQLAGLRVEQSPASAFNLYTATQVYRSNVTVGQTSCAVATTGLYRVAASIQWTTDGGSAPVVSFTITRSGTPLAPVVLAAAAAAATAGALSVQEVTATVLVSSSTDTFTVTSPGTGVSSSTLYRLA